MLMTAQTYWEEDKMDRTVLYQNETYEFILKELKGDGQTGAEITRRSLQDGEEIVLFSYFWSS